MNFRTHIKAALVSVWSTVGRAHCSMCHFDNELEIKLRLPNTGKSHVGYQFSTVRSILCGCTRSLLLCANVHKHGEFL